ncbi:MAG: hypothetical protein RSD71_09610, partial [Flavobacterium sp.]
ILADSYPNFDSFLENELTGLVDKNINEVKNVIEREYPEAMIVYTLRNYTKCRQMKKILTQ